MTKICSIFVSYETVFHARCESCEFKVGGQGQEGSSYAVGVWGSSHFRYWESTVLFHFSSRRLWAWNEIKGALCKPRNPVYPGGWLSLRRSWMGFAPLMILPGASPAASMEHLGKAPLGIFCSRIAATYLILLFHQPAVRLPSYQTLGALQVGGSSCKLHLLLCDFIAAYKGRIVPVFMCGFPNEGENKQLSLWCSMLSFKKLPSRLFHSLSHTSSLWCNTVGGPAEQALNSYSVCGVRAGHRDCAESTWLGTSQSSSLWPPR